MTLTFAIMFLISFLYERLYLDEQINTLITAGEELSLIYHSYESESAFLWRVQWTSQSLEADVIYFEQEHPLLEQEVLQEMLYEDNHIDFLTTEEQMDLLSGKTIVVFREHPNYTQEILGVIVPLIENGQFAGMLLLSQPLTSVYEPLSDLRTLAFVLLLVIFFLFIVTGKVISREISIPIQRMEKATLRMAAGHFKEKIFHSARSSELKRLENSLNFLAKSLNSEEETRREFIGNVSHELRTPLSYIKGYAEGIEKGIIDSKDGLPIIKEEAEAMLFLVNDLLDLTKLQSASYQIDREPVIFPQVIHDILDRFEIAASKQQITIQRQLDESCIVSGDSRRLEQVVRNLLDNAIKYSAQRTTIHVSLHKISSHLYRLTISDEGVGIPKEKLQHIKKRFYRVNNARTRSDGGTGLGLAIIDEIIKKHGGTFTISSKVKKGTTIEIDLHAYQDEESYS